MSGGKIDQIDWEKFKPFFSLISKNIGIQKARVGGNFAIAQAVQSRDQREHIRKTLPDVVFIVMSLTKGGFFSESAMCFSNLQCLVLLCDHNSFGRSKMVLV